MGCRYGSSCRFQHSSDSSTLPFSSNATTTTSFTSSKSKVPCRFFTSSGGCRYGASCHYLHDSAALSEQQAANKKKEPSAPSNRTLNELTVAGYVRNLQKLLPDTDVNGIVTLMGIKKVPPELLTLFTEFYSLNVQFDEDAQWHNAQRMQVKDTGNCISMTQTGWASAFLTEPIESGMHHYRFKIEQLDSRRGYYVLIGIWKQNSGAPILDSFFTDRRHNGHAMNLIDGTLTQPTLPGCGGIKYATFCKDNDVIDMYCDLNTNRLTFAINGKYYDNGPEIEHTRYRVAVTAYWKGDAIRFMSHDNASPLELQKK